MTGKRGDAPPTPWVVPTLAVVAVAIVALSLGGGRPKPCCDVAYAVHLPASLPAPAEELVRSVVADDRVSVSVDAPCDDEPARVLISYRGRDASTIHTVRNAAHRVARQCRAEPLSELPLVEPVECPGPVLVDFGPPPEAGRADAEPSEIDLPLLLEQSELLAALGGEFGAARPRVEKLRAVRRAPQRWVGGAPAALLLVLAAAVLRLVAPTDGKRLSTTGDASAALALPAREVLVSRRSAA